LVFDWGLLTCTYKLPQSKSQSVPGFISVCFDSTLHLIVTRQCLTADYNSTRSGNPVFSSVLNVKKYNVWSVRYSTVVQSDT